MYITEINKQENKLNIDEYWNNIPAIKNLSEIKIEKPITFFIGDNGTGKSTLLEAIAVNYGFNPEGGSKNFNFSTNKTHSNLFEDIMIVKKDMPKDGFFLRAESFYNVATEIEEISNGGIDIEFMDMYGGKSLHEQSHGESFLSLMLNRFRGNGLYILDEPEAALSPLKQMTILRLINELAEKNSQFIIATHSPILMATPNSNIFSFTENGIEEISYEETENYIFMKDFLNNYKIWIERLIN